MLKKDYWNTLADFIEIYTPTNIILAGDFNLVMHPKEKKGGNKGRESILCFVEDLIQQWDLVDIKPNRGRYTWSNNRIGPHHIAG